MELRDLIGNEVEMETPKDPVITPKQKARGLFIFLPNYAFN
ncbi:MAG: hypothetical protein RMI63_05990 [Caldimicrobium sp.]|nr:hypothetical protein [Caldimicrobium sp.]